MPIRWVGQEHQNGCGAACLAMLTGRTYAEVLAEIPFHSFHNDGMNNEFIDAILAGWGYAVARRYARNDSAEWEPEPFGEVHLCLVDFGGGNHHWVVMLADGMVLDPATQEPKRLSDYWRVDSVAAVVPIARTEDM